MTTELTITEPEVADWTTPLPASEATLEALEAARRTLPFEDERDFVEARRGYIATLDPATILDSEGRALWHLDNYAYLDGETPETVHPSLWRNARLSTIHGLFEVVEGVYQVRGFDVSNVSFVLGETGYIVIDPLTSVEAARTAFDLVREHLGDRPVTGVVYTHSHVDHFGGVKGVLSAEDAAARNVPIIAPADFLGHAVDENLHAGNAMHRRAQYMFGGSLERATHGQVAGGVGPSTAHGTVSLIPPTHSISQTGQKLHVDGVTLEFQITPGTEAPSDMNVYLPDHKALNLADNLVRTLHNLYTPRGAKVRDAIAWSGYLDEAIERYGDRTDAILLGHQWPAWGAERITELLEKQRDLYRYIHDETLRLANQGWTIDEIPERIELPESLSRYWSNRDNYGTVKHNSKAVYQFYLGYFDGNPANLDAHEPTEAARRYVDIIGGIDVLLEKARASFRDGDYRWVAEVVGHAVFADPTHVEARELQAAAFEQLGYQAESAPWRNFYLTGAQELRSGVGSTRGGLGSPDLAYGTTFESLVAHLGIRLNGPRAAEHDFTLNVEVAPTRERAVLEVRNGVLTPQFGVRDDAAAASVTVSHEAFARLALGSVRPSDLSSTELSVTGDAQAFDTFVDLLDVFDRNFPIVTP